MSVASDIGPTPLERSLLDIFHQLHAAEGFASPSEVSVVSRENTGGGRYVSLRCADRGKLSDGYYDLGGKYIQMAGIPNGMMAVARVAKGHLVEIEIAVYGNDHWDGSEPEWSIV